MYRGKCCRVPLAPDMIIDHAQAWQSSCPSTFSLTWKKLQRASTQTWGHDPFSHIIGLYLSCLVCENAHGQSPCLQGDASINGPWSIAMLLHQKVLFIEKPVHVYAEILSRHRRTLSRVYIVVRPLAELCISFAFEHQHSFCRNPSHLAQTMRRPISTLSHTN